jgi:uncharacterized protein YndB with AHSA1/START domain
VKEATVSRTIIDATPGTPFIDVTREFDAPRELVWKAWTEPELLKQWLGPAKYEMVVDEWDVRDGGRWRYVHRGEEGDFAFHGVFHGEPSPDNFVQTFEFEGAPGHVSLERLSLEERDGRTIARTHSTFQSVEARDAMIEGGMESGLTEGFDRLEALLGRLSPAGVH